MAKKVVVKVYINGVAQGEAGLEPIKEKLAEKLLKPSVLASAGAVIITALHAIGHWLGKI